MCFQDRCVLALEDQAEFGVGQIGRSTIEAE